MEAAVDILGALEADSSTRGPQACRVQRFLNDIPDDTPGKAELVETIETSDPKSPAYRTQNQVLGVLSRIGLNTSDTSVGEHRRGVCRCYR